MNNNEENFRFGENFRFEIDKKKVYVYPSKASDRPIVYLNTFSGEGREILSALLTDTRRDFSLVTIGNLNWDCDMAPWDIPPIAKNDTPCTGGADEYLKVLTEKIIPAAEQSIQGQAPWRAIAGYSLAGLFALYSLYKTDIFSRAASMSGSLWFPGIREYIFNREMKVRPERLYFSLGDKECKTRNPILKTVQQNTEEIYDFCRQKGIDTVFRLNAGNHYKDTVERTAAGISWLLEK